MLDGIRGLTALVAAGGVVLTLAGFFGAAHPAFDTLAALRLHMGLAFAAIFVFAMAFAALTARFIALGGLAIVAAGVVPSMVPQDPVGAEDLRVLSHNLRYDNATPEAVVAAVAARDVDVVLLQEVSERTRVVADALRFRTEVLCDFGAVGGVAVLSRFPMVGQPGCARGQGVAWARLRTAAGEVTVATLHLPWPWPYGQQQRQATRVAEILADLEEPLLIAGDFNGPTWSHAMRQVQQITGTRALNGLRLTFQRAAFWPGLPLDHVLVSEDLTAQVEQLEPFGSDHAALLTRARLR